MINGKNVQESLHEPFALRQEEIDFYRENGYVKLKHVFPRELPAHYREEIARKVAELNTQHLPLEKRSTYDRAFLQVMNLWTRSDVVREFVFGRRLARIAAELMECSGVRMYHDQALYKEPGGGITPWHADQYYWPVSSEKVITAWIPLQDVPLEMGPLAFCEKSHRFQVGRDLEISDESELTLKQALGKFKLEESPFELGDVSFHSGWTFHRAGPNQTEQPREVMTIIYMDEDMRLARPKNKNQIADNERWCPGVQPGEVVASHLNPVLYTSKPVAAG
jgi:ectoine hydroxylase-related dioxygenase (phytanoyl-CoA dioxygenase family)